MQCLLEVWKANGKVPYTCATCQNYPKHWITALNYAFLENLPLLAFTYVHRMIFLDVVSKRDVNIVGVSENSDLIFSFFPLSSVGVEDAFRGCAYLSFSRLCSWISRNSYSWTVYTLFSLRSTFFFNERKTKEIF